MTTGKDVNGDKHSEIITGDTPEKAFETWFLEEYQGAEWDELDFGGLFPLKETFNEVTLYLITGNRIDFDYAGFINKHDKRANEEKDPEYKEYLRLKNKFGEDNHV